MESNSNKILSYLLEQIKSEADLTPAKTDPERKASAMLMKECIEKNKDVVESSKLIEGAQLAAMPDLTAVLVPDQRGFVQKFRDKGFGSHHIPRKTRQQLVPPKPNELESTNSCGCLRA